MLTSRQFADLAVGERELGDGEFACAFQGGEKRLGAAERAFVLLHPRLRHRGAVFPRTVRLALVEQRERVVGERALRREQIVVQAADRETVPMLETDDATRQAA